MSELDPSVFQSGGGLTPVEQANIVFGDPVANPPDPMAAQEAAAQQAGAVYLELADVASAATVEHIEVTLPPTLAAAAALTAQVSAVMDSAVVQAHSVSSDSTARLLAEEHRHC